MTFLEYTTAALLAAAGGALATPLLARLALRIGWTDAAAGALAARKMQRHPVPAVGGAAVLLGALLGALVLRSGEGAGLLLVAATPAAIAGAALSLLGLFVVGLVDDRRPEGLAPRGKLMAQAGALLPVALALAVAYGGDGPLAVLGVGVALLVGGLVAVNTLNTFDNADGALGTVALVGFAAPSPLLAGALLGFLPWNLNAREGEERDPGACPTAYLGDAGSHALGLLVLLTPIAWPLLLLPLLDLARLSVVRVRAGSRPWIGDRRHLAHRLAHRGLPRRGVAAVLGAIAAPACGTAAWGWLGGETRALPLLLGISGTMFLFLVALLATGAGKAPREGAPPPRPAGATED